MSTMIHFIILVLTASDFLANTYGKECCYNRQFKDKELFFDTNKFKHSEFLKEAKWPDRTVYYDIDPHMDPIIRHFVAHCIDYFNKKDVDYGIDDGVSLASDGCIQFVQRRPDGVDDSKQYWVTFSQTREHENILYSNLGYGDFMGVKNTRVYISYPYVVKNKNKGDKRFITDLLHEMMHVLGFNHEFDRRDRDCHVYVSDLIIADDPDSFEVHAEDYFYSPDFPYDFESVLHYTVDFAGTEFYPHNTSVKLGRSDGQISSSDWEKINYVYCDAPTYCDWYRAECNEIYEEYLTNPNCYREGPKYSDDPLTCVEQDKCDPVF